MQEEELEEEHEEVQEEVQEEEGSYCLSANGKGHKPFTNTKKYYGHSIFWIYTMVFFE